MKFDLRDVQIVTFHEKGQGWRAIHIPTQVTVQRISPNGSLYLRQYKKKELLDELKKRVEMLEELPTRLEYATIVKKIQPDIDNFELASLLKAWDLFTEKSRRALYETLWDSYYKRDG